MILCFVITLHSKFNNKSFAFRYLIDLPDYLKKILISITKTVNLSKTKPKKSSAIVPPFIIITNHNKWMNMRACSNRKLCDQSSGKISRICNYTFEILNLLESSGQIITLYVLRNFIGSPQLLFTYCFKPF